MRMHVYLCTFVGTCDVIVCGSLDCKYTTSRLWFVGLGDLARVPVIVYILSCNRISYLCCISCFMRIDLQLQYQSSSECGI